MKSKSQKVREAIEQGLSNKEIVEKLKIPVSTVYTVRWAVKKGIQPKKLGRPRKHKAHVRVATPVAPKSTTPMSDFLREELAGIERQIDNLHTIASFLTIRLRQMEHNGE